MINGNIENNISKYNDHLEGECLINKLPNEIIDKIFRILDFYNLFSLNKTVIFLVNKHWKDLTFSFLNRYEKPCITKVLDFISFFSDEKLKLNFKKYRDCLDSKFERRESRQYFVYREKMNFIKLLFTNEVSIDFSVLPPRSYIGVFQCENGKPCVVWHRSTDIEKNFTSSEQYVEDMVENSLPTPFKNIFQWAQYCKKLFRLIDNNYEGGRGKLIPKFEDKIRSDLIEDMLKNIHDDSDIEIAIQVILKLSYDYDKNKFFKNLCNFLAINGNIDRAKKVAFLITNKSIRNFAFENICQVLVDKDNIEKAIEIAIAMGMVNDDALKYVCNLLLLKGNRIGNIERSIHTALLIFDSVTREETLIKIFQYLMYIYESKENIQLILNIVDMISDESIKNEAFKEIRWKYGCQTLKDNGYQLSNNNWVKNNGKICSVDRDQFLLRAFVKKGQIDKAIEFVDKICLNECEEKRDSIFLKFCEILMENGNIEHAIKMANDHISHSFSREYFFKQMCHLLISQYRIKEAIMASLSFYNNPSITNLVFQDILKVILDKGYIKEAFNFAHQTTVRRSVKDYIFIQGCYTLMDKNPEDAMSIACEITDDEKRQQILQEIMNFL